MTTPPGVGRKSWYIIIIISKYWEFGELKVLGYGTKSDMTSKYGTIFLAPLHVITNEKTLKLKQIDRLPALPRFSPQKHVLTTLVGIPVDIYTLR